MDRLLIFVQRAVVVGSSFCYTRLPYSDIDYDIIINKDIRYCLVDFERGQGRYRS